MLDRFNMLRAEVREIGNCIMYDLGISERLVQTSSLQSDLEALDKGVFTIAVVAPHLALESLRSSMLSWVPTC